MCLMISITFFIHADCGFKIYINDAVTKHRVCVCKIIKSIRLLNTVILSLLSRYTSVVGTGLTKELKD